MSFRAAAVVHGVIYPSELECEFAPVPNGGEAPR